MSLRRFNEPITGVICDVDVPDGFLARDRSVHALGYPFELGTVMAPELPPASSDGSAEAHPPVELLPPRGTLLWLVIGDRSFEAEFEAGVQRPIISRVGGRVQIGAAALTGKEEVASAHDNLRTWSRVVELGSSGKYCQLFAYVGMSSFAPLDALSRMVGTLSFRA